MTKLVSQLTVTKNAIVNIVTLLVLSFIAITLIACVVNIDLTILNRSF